MTAASSKVLPAARRTVPYRTNHELPASVRRPLPEHAQDIYRAAFNEAYTGYVGEADREARADMLAWAAVKRSYTKDGESWVPKDNVPATSRKHASAGSANR